MNDSREQPRGPRYTREQIRMNRIKAATGVLVVGLLAAGGTLRGLHTRSENKAKQQRSDLEAQRSFLRSRAGHNGEVSALDEAIVLKPGVKIYSTEDLKQQLQSGKPTSKFSYGRKSEVALLIVEPVEPARTFEKGVESWWYGFTLNTSSEIDPAFEGEPVGTIFWVEATALTSGQGELAYPQSAINTNDPTHPFLESSKTRHISIDPETNAMHIAGHPSERAALAHAFKTYADAERASIHEGFAA